MNGTINNTLDRKLLEGDLKKNLLKLSIPTMLGFVLMAVYDMVDMIWVGRISSQAVAGVTIFSTIFWLVSVLNEIIGTSSISMITQSYGMGDEEKTRKIVEQTLTFKVFMAIIAAILFLIFLKPLLHFFSDDPEVIKAALDYGYIRVFFLPIMFASYSVNTALRCLGDANTPMIIMTITSVLNIILDPIFMFDKTPGINIPGLGMGVFGAALATVISTAIAFLFGFWILLKGKTKLKISIKGLFKLDWEIDKKLLTIGLPAGFEVLTRNLSGVITMKFVSMYGTDTVAAVGIGTKLMSFAFMPAMGISIGTSTIVGQCLGADSIKRAKDTARYATFVNIIIMGAIVTISMIFPENIMRIFIKDPNVIKIGKSMLQIICPALLGAAIVMGYGSVFSASGHNTPFLLSSIISRWIIQIPLLFLITNVLKLSVIYVWASFIVSSIVEIIIVLIAYKKGTWETKRV
jgi:putative MATE family efflux protein